LRSTFIVGFPGEIEAEFETLLEFIEDAGIDRLGAFAYSPVEGAVANTLPNPVPEDIKQERLERLMTRQAALSAERLKARIGRTCRVLVDARTEDGLIGRSYAEAPEIDGVIHIAAAEARPGDFVDCRIVATDIHDLTGIVATTFER
jgi:ribosomal protein S12 methylthiotransferase